MITVVGGYGTFGAHVSRALASRGHDVRIGGRDPRRAASFAESEGLASGFAVDIRDARSCVAACEGSAVVVCAAGPFSDLGTTLVEACLDAGCHYVDIADDRVWAQSLTNRRADLSAAGCAIVSGASSLPGRSLPLALAARDAADAPFVEARATLFIGNGNRKGIAAVTSAVAAAGEEIPAGTETLVGFRDGWPIDLPSPFGRTRARAFESPDLDLLPPVLDGAQPRVGVGFGLGLVGFAIEMIARAPRSWRPGMRRAFVALAARAPRIGSTGGGVQVDATTARGARWRATAFGEHDAQILAVVPAVEVADRLARGTVEATGLLWPHEVAGPDAILEAVTRSGFRVEIAEVPPRTT